MRLLLAAVLIALPAAADAFVCTRVEDGAGVESGPSVSWFRRAIGFALSAEGTGDMTGLTEHDVLRRSFDVWITAQECRPPNRVTDVRFAERPLSSVDRIGFDFLAPESNENLLIFRDTAWPHAGQMDKIIALTTTTFNALTGEIIDADIEFNSADFAFKDCTAEPCNGQNGSPDADLENTAVHEIGHLLGLGHTTISGATMLAHAQPGETEKRDLACDDLNAAVFKYPASAANGYCAPSADCGYCAPPGELSTIPTVSVEDSDDGLGGCDCDAGRSAVPWLAALALLRRRVAVRLK